jgi:hypothetical protein
MKLDRAIDMKLRMDEKKPGKDDIILCQIRFSSQKYATLLIPVVVYCRLVLFSTLSGKFTHISTMFG